MNLTRPSDEVFYISAALAVFAVIAFAGVLSIGVEAFWLMLIAYVVLVFGVLFND
jgi:type IV secretory pathway VirB3-like protein